MTAESSQPVSAFARLHRFFAGNLSNVHVNLFCDLTVSVFLWIIELQKDKILNEFVIFTVRFTDLTTSHSFQIHTYPPTAKSFVEKHRSSIYVYLADIDTGVLNGYRFVAKENKVR